MSIVLRNQIEASVRCAEELGSELRREHHRALLCYEVQDLVQSVVDLFGRLNQDVERWQADVRRDDVRAELEPLGPAWHELYQNLSQCFEKTAQLISGMESLGFQVDGKQEFKIAWRNLRGVVCFSRDRVDAAAAQIAHGAVRPLAEVRDELWDSPVR